jgi:hypothetical protein
MRYGRLLLAGAVVASLGACSPQAPVHDKAFYAAHADERAQAISACQADPGRLAATPNCLNAQSADADAHAAHFYDAPKPTSRAEKSSQL